MFLIFLTFLTLLIIILYYKKYKHRNELLSKIPSPKKYPLIHNSLDVIGLTPEGIFEWMEDLKNKFGSVYQTTFDPFDDGTIITSDPKVIEGILTSQVHLKKSSEYDMMKNWLGTGLLISTGNKWRQRRKILTPAFHFQILDKFVEVMGEHANVLIEKLNKRQGHEIDIHPLLNLYALDVICESAMGCKIDAQNVDSDYVKAVKEIAILIFKRTNDPIRRFYYIYKFTDMYKREKELLKIVHGFTNKIINMRKKMLKNQNETKIEEDETGVKKKLALLDLLLQAQVDGQPLSVSDIREEVDTFMFAGHDTTTSGTSFILYNIAKYPEVQEKVYREIIELFGDDKNQEISLQDLNKLHYMELVIKETFRLFPPIPYFGREVSEEFTAGGYTFPRHSTLFVSPYLMGRDENIFPDPLTFDPHRFDSETKAEKINPFAFVPFSAGPRNCIGQKFAMLEMKLIVTKIIKNFELKISKEHEDLILFSEIVLRSVCGIVLRFNKR